MFKNYKEKIIFESPNPTDIFCYSPCIFRTSKGSLIATMDLGGDGVAELPGEKGSRDKGRRFGQGKIFISNHKIYRPSQDCSENYGNALNISEITILNESEYSEKLVSKVRANWNKNKQRIHTYNFDDHISVIDGFTNIWKI